MSQNSREFLEEMYPDLAKLGGRENFHICQSKMDGRIYIKKEIQAANTQVYEALQNMPCKNLPKVYEVAIISENRVLVIEEYIHGQTLETVLKQNNLTEERATEIILEILRGLSSLHSLNPPIIHRDLKPSNIMINEDGIVKIMDYNIARVYKNGESADTVFMGTNEFAAPEQYGFAQSDARSDLFAVGVIAKRMLREPFSPYWKRFCDTCTQIDAVNRFQNAQAAADFLTRHILREGGPWIERSEKVFSLPIPGFRSGNIVHMILAVFGYLAFFASVWDVQFKDSAGKPVPPTAMWIERGGFVLAFFLALFMLTDYLQIRRFSQEQETGIRGFDGVRFSCTARFFLYL